MVVYLIILEIEFRQLKKAVKNLLEITKNLRGIEDELEDDLKLLKGRKKRKKK
jgi:hypothetical protein